MGKGVFMCVFMVGGCDKNSFESLRSISMLYKSRDHGEPQQIARQACSHAYSNRTDLGRLPRIYLARARKAIECGFGPKAIATRKH